MAIVYKSDLLSTELSEYFNKLEISNNKIASVIDGFNGTSQSLLTGNGYDAIRIRLEFYADALRKAATLCGLFSNNVTAAQHQLANYMEDIDILDDSEIGETKAKLDAAKADLAYLESYYRTTWTDSEGNSHECWERVGTDEQIAACKEAIAYLDHLLEKLMGLAGADDGAFSLLSDISNDINSLDRAINGIEVLSFTTSNDDFYDSLDMSDFTSEEKEILRKLIDSWPADLSDERKRVIEIALSYLHAGHGYSMGRGMKDYGEPYKGTATPDGGIYMDCAYFMSKIIMDYASETGVDAKIQKPSYTGVWSNYVDSNIGRDDLQPGDFAMTGDGHTHIAMYLGTVDGRRIFIDCSHNKDSQIEYYGNTEAVRIIGESKNKNSSSYFESAIDLDNILNN